MATIRINGDLPTDGDGSFATPYNVPPSASDSNTYLFCEGSTTSLALNWILGRTDVTLGTYDSRTGDQIIDKSRQATVTIEVANTGTIATINVGNTTRVKIQSLNIINEAPNATNRMGIYNSAATTDLQVTDCTIHGMRGSSGTHNGLQLVGSANTRPYVARNRVYNCGQDGLHFQTSTGLVVEDNVISMVSQDDALGDCIQLSGAVPDYLITRNVLDRRSGQAGKQAFIASGMTSTGGSFSYNKILADSTDTTACYTEQANAIVVGNEIRGGSQGVEVQGNNSLVQGNVVLPNDDHVSTYIGIRLASGTGIQVLNNTIIANTTPKASTYGIRQVSGSASFARNNIISGFATGFSGGAVTESNNWCYNNTTDGATPVGSSVPGLRADFTPMSSDIRSVGQFVGGLDFYGRNANTTIGAVQYIAARSLESRTLTTRTTATRTVAIRRGITA